MTELFSPDGGHKRRMLLHISPEILVDLLSLDGTRLIEIKGMPKDARIINVSDQMGFDRDQISFMIESSEFPAIQKGCHIPEMKLDVRLVKLLDDEPIIHYGVNNV